MSTAVKRKAEDGTDVMISRPPPPLPHAQPYFCPPGPMPMDFRGQQWMAGGPGAGVWGGPRMMPNQFFHRGRGSQRIFYPGQARGMRMPPQNYNFNQNLWNRPPPPFMDGMAPPPQGVDGFHNVGAPGSSWMPNTAVPPPAPTHSQAQSSTTSPSQFDGTNNHYPPATSVTENGESYSANNMKKKKKDKSGKAPVYNSRPWNREDAEKALALENECQRNSTEQSLVIRFPDPELSKEIVRKFHPSIESVHFQAPSGARFCFAQLVEGANVDKVITDIEKIKFGVGKLKAERKLTKNEDPVTPEAIDPYTLYVGNLPTNISTQVVKEKFPTAHRIDIGYAAKMKYTRYAFIRYQTAEAAMKAYKSAVNMQIASRSIILRFRRHKGPVGPPGECQSEHLKTIPKIPKIKKEKEDLEEDDEDDENDYDDDDDDDEDDDDDDDDDDEEDGDVNNMEEDYDDDDDDEEEDEDDDEEDDDEDEEDEPIPKEEESDDDDDDKDDKYQDPF